MLCWILGAPVGTVLNMVLGLALRLGAALEVGALLGPKVLEGAKLGSALATLVGA